MKRLTAIACFFALSWGLSAQPAGLPFFEPLVQNGTTVVLQLFRPQTAISELLNLGAPEQLWTLGISIAPADALATQFSAKVALQTVDGEKRICTVSGPVDTVAAYTSLGITLPVEITEVTGLEVVAGTSSAWGKPLPASSGAVCEIRRP